MTQILALIQNNIDGVIIVSGIILAVLLIWIGVVLSGKKSRIEEALFAKESRYLKDVIKKEIVKEESDSKPTPDKIRSLELDFNNACSLHDVFVQFIPIFPLLGILGTVAGLMLQVGAGDDVTKMIGSLNTALGSTLFGIIFAILLKIIEAVFPSRIINSVDIMLDDFGKRVNLAETFQNSQDDK